MKNLGLNILRQLYSSMSYMKKRYPKAAKKRRILNKWRNRFGEDFKMEDFIFKQNPVSDWVKNDDSFHGN